MHRCIFEEGMWAQNLRKKGLKLDIATMLDGKPQLLTDGLTQREQEEEAGMPGFGYMLKSQREKTFPLAVLQLGYRITAGEAKATEEEDKRRIINSINGCDPKQLDTTEPVLDHFECDRVNRILRGVFAEASLNAAARADYGTRDEPLDGADEEEPHNLLSAMSVLVEDTERSELLIDLQMTGITHTNELGAATLGKLQALTQLNIHFDGCFGLVDVSAVGEGLAQLKALQELNIRVWSCSALVDVSAIGEGLAQLKALKELNNIFMHCSGLVDVSAIGEGLAQLKALTQLTISFCGCFALVDVSAVGEGLAQLKALKELNIDFRHCSGLVDVSAVGKGLAQLKALKELTIDFRACSGLVDVGSFDAKYLQHMTDEQKNISI